MEVCHVLPRVSALVSRKPNPFWNMILGYTLHKPTRRKFPTLPVKVFTIDEQWTADLIEVINISKQNKGYKYLLTMVDVFSKHAWVEPIKNKTGQAVTVAFEKILKQGRTPKHFKHFRAC